MIYVGITGQSGFIGTHLYNYLSLKKDEITLIPFRDEYFSDTEQLDVFVKKCDKIVHLAALNRHPDPKEIFDTNIILVKKLIDSCNRTNSRPHILFSSSTQEELDNLYGRSKSVGRELFSEWAKKSDARFTGMVIPNVFGPFGKPFYNSVVATFCYQLTHNQQPVINVDADLKLIYVGEVTEIFYKNIINEHQGDKSVTIHLPHNYEIKVSEVLAILQNFKVQYFEKGIFPDLSDRFTLLLFNTFVCYIEHKDFYPFYLMKNSDERGSFVETVRMNSGGQISFSTTKPGITRGNHFHTRKAERFAVIRGNARIELRRFGTDEVLTFNLNGENPSFVDMPVWFTHNITNTGDQDVFTIFWINEPFNPEDPDTFFEAVR
jgi:UDP-2-acetamido-2,6-beta-L-arabino-hexul-4-ose reductase